MEFYTCKHCGNIIAFAKNSGAPVTCCGQQMQKIEPNTTDAAKEKHVPVITVDGNAVTVSVSTVAHPMVDVHYIEWVALETEQGNQRKELHPGEAPVAKFALCEGDKPIAAYAYCNLHGLWKGTM